MVQLINSIPASTLYELSVNREARTINRIADMNKNYYSYKYTSKSYGYSIFDIIAHRYKANNKISYYRFNKYNNLIKNNCTYNRAISMSDYTNYYDRVGFSQYIDDISNSY
jgi:hypothetical protein